MKAGGGSIMAALMQITVNQCGIALSVRKGREQSGKRNKMLTNLQNN